MCNCRFECQLAALASAAIVIVLRHPVGSENPGRLVSGLTESDRLHPLSARWDRASEAPARVDHPETSEIRTGAVHDWRC